MEHLWSSHGQGDGWCMEGPMNPQRPVIEPAADTPWSVHGTPMVLYRTFTDPPAYGHDTCCPELVSTAFHGLTAMAYPFAGSMTGRWGFIVL